MKKQPGIKPIRFLVLLPLARPTHGMLSTIMDQLASVHFFATSHTRTATTARGTRLLHLRDAHRVASYVDRTSLT